MRRWVAHRINIDPRYKGIMDTFSVYERGLEELLERLDKSHSSYLEILTLQLRLMENITQTRRFGDTETRRAERAQTIEALNVLAMNTVGTSFNELCQLASQYRMVRIYRGHTWHVNSVCFSSDNKLLASGSGDLRAIVRYVETGESIAILKYDRWVGSVNFTSDDRHLITSDRNGVIRVWNIAERTVIAEEQAHEGPCRAVDVAPNGEWLVSGGKDGVIRIWQIPSLQPVVTIGEHQTQVRRLALSPDGKHICAGDESGIVYLWSIDEQSRLRLLESKDAVIRTVAYAPDGMSVAATDSEGRLWLIDVESRFVRWKVQAHQGHAIGLCFAPSGQSIATGGQDHLIRLWDTSSGMLQRNLTQHSNTVTCLAFASNGKWLASGSRDQAVCLWQV
jgi:WD40 repeat protein